MHTLILSLNFLLRYVRSVNYELMKLLFMSSLIRVTRTRRSTHLIEEGCSSNFVIALSSIMLENYRSTIFYLQYSRSNFKFLKDFPLRLCTSFFREKINLRSQS